MNGTSATPSCLFCGEPEHVEIIEVWSDHSFQIDTCCLGMHEAVSAEMSEDGDHSLKAGKSGPGWTRKLVSEAMGTPARRIVPQDGGLLIDFELKLDAIAFSEAKAFVTSRHEHCPGPTGWKFGIGLHNGPTLIGVAMVGRPVARMLPQDGSVLEVNRLCLDRAIPDALRWNGCSMLYGWAAKEARKRRAERIITYIRDDEPGTSLLAAGWALERSCAGGSRTRDGRSRAEHNTVPKQRWGKQLIKQRSGENRSSASMKMPLNKGHEFTAVLER